jgi:hypothetical protein
VEQGGAAVDPVVYSASRLPKMSYTYVVNTPLVSDLVTRWPKPS